MALKGNLRDFSLVQLLNLINLAKKTGALTIEGVNVSTRLFFRDGKLTYAFTGVDTIPLIRIMARTKLIPNSLAASLGERNKNLTDKEMGIYLINSGYLSQQQIFTGIAAYLSEIVRILFTWKQGDFHFEVNELPPEQCIPVRMDLEKIILEGSRMLHDLDDLRAEIPSLDMALKFIERPDINIHNVNLNAEEWRVVSYINPKYTIRQIAGAAKLDELQIRRVVLNLIQAGLVEIVRPAIGLNSPVQRPQTRRELVEQRSFVTRVIDRIKAI